MEAMHTASKRPLASTACSENIRTKRVLVVSTSFPSRVQPVYGVFVKERLRFLAQRPDVDLRVISPTPYFPPIKACKRWYPFSQVPRVETVDGIHVERPRYPFLPKIGGYCHPQLMFPSVLCAVRKLKASSFDFNVIDSHFVYPSGVAAARLGQRLGIPVVITGRGEDMLRFPRLPLIGKQIRWALQHATQLIAVSDEIAHAMIDHGANPQKITVIPNGIDTDKFAPIPMLDARRDLGLSPERKIVVSVGYRLERKGFHILVDAIPRIREVHPDILLVIVGGQARWAKDYLPVIQERVRALGLENHVLIAGDRPQTELPLWYSAADAFALMTSREGSPNVLMEALACGVPAVATGVGGIPSVLGDRSLGIVLEERTAEAAFTGITRALSTSWDRNAIRDSMLQYSWAKTAGEVVQVFDKAIAPSAHSSMRTT